MKQELKAAMGYTAASILLFLTEIVIGIYGLGIVRKYIGDAAVLHDPNFHKGSAENAAALDVRRWLHCRNHAVFPPE